MTSWKRYESSWRGRRLDTKPISVQALNIECPRCGSGIGFDCRAGSYGELPKPHEQRIRAMQTLIRESKNDWIIRKILRERNFAK